MKLKWLIFLILPVFAELDDSQQEVMDMFDLVEEVGVNFYDYIDINPDATKKEINKQYRTLAKTWHPDRNSSETAGDNFRILAAITEVIRVSISIF